MMIEIPGIGRVPEPQPPNRRDKVPPVEPVELVVPQKPETDTVEISEEARQLLEESQRKKEELENEITPEEEAEE